MPPPEPPVRRTLLAETLKAVRRRRGLRAADVARRLGMPLRTYEHFEAGRGKIDYARLAAFARALDADLNAILLAVEFAAPAFALRCLDNKLASAVLVSLDQFNRRAGDAMVALDPRTVVETLDRAFGQLTETARERQAFVESWMTQDALTPPDDEEANDAPFDEEAVEPLDGDGRD